MASSVQFENTYPEDERWLDAGAHAFALHFAACCYTDRHNKDGVIPKAMVSRVALAVPPDQVDAAVEALLMAGFWTQTKTAYRIVNFLEDKIGISAEEKLENKKRWADDKRWRRKHNAGNHAECPPDKCRQSGKVSHSDSQGTPRKSPAGVQEDSYRTTRPDSIRPDSTRPDLRSGRASESGGRTLSVDSAGATSPESPADGADGAGVEDRVPAITGRTLKGVRVTADMIGGVDPWSVNSIELEALLAAHRHPAFAPNADAADPADSLAGLIPAGGADR